MASHVAVTSRAAGVAAVASTSTRSRPPQTPRCARRASRSVLSRSASRDDVETDDDGTTSASDLVELECGGVSVSPRGFVALMVRKGVKDRIPRAANEVEVMRGADPSADLAPEIASEFVLPVLITDLDEDAEAARSARAQTMLQLLQDPPCDMGIQLPYAALEEVTGVTGGAVLGAVLVGKASFGDCVSGAERDGEPKNEKRASSSSSSSSFVWESTLLAGAGAEQSAVDVLGGASEAWQCLALARRYEQYGCRVFATKEALAGAATKKSFSAFFGDETDDAVADADAGAAAEPAALTVSTVRRAFPRMQTVNESRAIAAEAREKFLWQPFAAAVAEDDAPGETDGDDETP